MGKKPEELTKLFTVVDGVKGAEVGGLGIKAYGPAVVRAQLFRLIHGNTPVIQAAAHQVLGPRIAKQITQKAIIKTVVPIVGVGISAGWNYATTRMMGTRVRHGVRVTAALREETLRLQGQIGRNEQAEVAALEGLMALALADRNFDDKERDVDLTFLKQLGLPEEEMQRLAEKVDADLAVVCAALGSIQEPANRESVARCFYLIAAGDGELQAAEQEILVRLLEALGWAGKQFSKVKPAVGDTPEMEFEASIEEKTNAVILAGMERLTQRFAAGELSQEEYKGQFAVLVGQLKS
jgi:tellurite resistance protein